MIYVVIDGNTVSIKLLFQAKGVEKPLDLSSKLKSRTRF